MDKIERILLVVEWKEKKRKARHKSPEHVRH